MESGEDLHKVHCPTLILQGDHDTMTERQQREMAQRIPQSKFVYIKNAHHAANLDKPVQVNHEIINLLTEIEA